MRILDKYISKIFLGTFFYCLVLFIFLYIIIDMFGHLDEILKYGVPILVLQEYYLSMVPFIILHTAPMASLISTISVINTMNRYDEITAMRAAGINIYRIFFPFICIGILISLSVFALSEKVLPLNMKNVTYIKENYFDKGASGQTKEKGDKIVNNITLYGKNDTIIFIESYNLSTHTARGITLLKQDKNGMVTQKLNAREAKWTGSTWESLNTIIYKLDETGAIKGAPLFFEQKNIDIESPDELISKGVNYEVMNFKDLWRYIKNFSNASPEIINRLRVEAHQKIAIPFASLVIIILGSSIAIRVKPRGKATTLLGIGLTIIIGFIYYATMAIFIAFGKRGIIPPLIAVQAVNVVFLSIGLLLIKN